ncbi:MAG TPA: FAD-binding protein [Pseudonocardiaceae bacterium]
MPQDDVTTVDLVVVGAGTGLLGAIAAADAGRRVLVVEKSRYVGGSTSMSGGGFWIPGNSLLREFGVSDSRERASAYLDALVGDTAPRERRQSFLEHGPEAVEVLRRSLPNSWQHMREYSDYFPEVEGGSAFGRAIEPAPFNLALLGDDRSLLRPPPLAAPVPMPITGRDYKFMNLVARQPSGAIAIAKRVGEGLGGKLLGREYAAGGQALAAGLLIAARKHGVTIWTESPLRDLVVERGRVVGVVVQREGHAVSVRAERGVLLSAGGFEHNREMRQKYQSNALSEDWSLANPANTGDVIRIAQGNGAALTLMDQAWWFPAIPPIGDKGYPGTLLAERSLPGSLIVDGTGSRFFDEAVNYMTAGQIMLGIGRKDDKAPHLPAWLVFDQTYRNRYVLGGAVMPRMPLPKAWYDAGVAHKANSLAELSQQVAAPALAETVQRFNLLAAQGHDDDFGRGNSAYDRYYGDPTVHPNPNLGPLTRPPFYAVQVVPGDLGTCGGIQADGLARVVSTDGSVIEGLYASGNAAGNAFGAYYPGPGATIGQGLTFGYIAATHAVGKLPTPAAAAS